MLKEDGCNIEVILYLRTMTSKYFVIIFIERDLYDKLGLFQYKDSFNRTLNQGYDHYQSLVEKTKALCSRVHPTQFYE
jgi:hypothetical protein